MAAAAAAQSYNAFDLTVTPQHYVTAVGTMLAGALLGALIGQMRKSSEIACTHMTAHALAFAGSSGC